MISYIFSKMICLRGVMRAVLAIFSIVALITGYGLYADRKGNTQTAIAAPCSSVTADEQQFAFGLTPEHRKVFCEQFTPVQRAAAMQLTSQPDPTGALLSPDDAVEKVAQAVNISPNSSAKGVCPVK